MNIVKNKILFPCVAILLLFLIVNLQFTIGNKFISSSKETFLYLPSGKFIKGISLAYDEMVADFLWIKLIGYFGTHAKTDRDYRWLNHFLNIITELDPYSEYVYETGGIILSAEMEFPEKSIKLLKKGMDNVIKNHPRYWKLPFFIAFNYMYYLKDFKKAAYYLEIAAKSENSPTYLPLLVSRLYANDNYHNTAIEFLDEMLNDTQNTELRHQLEIRIEELVNDRNIRMLESARDRFFRVMKRYPFILYELVLYGFIKNIPYFSEGSYYIDWNNYSVFHSTVGGKLDIHVQKDSPGIEITVEEKDGK